MVDETYPFNPGSWPGAPETSRHAAASVDFDAGTLRLKCLGVVRDAKLHGATTDEGAEKLQLPNNYMSRPRFAELHAAGQIVDSGRRRRNASGRLATVWIVPEHLPLRLAETEANNG